MLTQLPARVPWTQSAHVVHCGVRRACRGGQPAGLDDRGPRLLHRRDEVFSSHSMSLIIRPDLLAAALGLEHRPGTVAEWFPQIVTLRIELNGLPIFWRDLADGADCGRRIIAVNCAGFRPGAFFMAMRQLVLAGLPTTSTLTWRARGRGERLALRREDPAVRLEQILALIPGPPRTGADEERDFDVLECDQSGRRWGPCRAAAGRRSRRASIITPSAPSALSRRGSRASAGLNRLGLPSISPLAMRKSRL